MHAFPRLSLRVSPSTTSDAIYDGELAVGAREPDAQRARTRAVLLAARLAGSGSEDSILESSRVGFISASATRADT